jgi:predicted nucleic acid-binding protein
MYLVDTDVISEARKDGKADAGVRAFFSEVQQDDAPLYISAITLGELRRGVERVRQRGDRVQAAQLERWLKRVTSDFAGSILAFDEDAAQVWGRLRVPHPENLLDKQIAATALIHDLTVVTRNVAHFEPTGARVRNPFRGPGSMRS